MRLILERHRSRPANDQFDHQPGETRALHLVIWQTALPTRGRDGDLTAYRRIQFQVEPARFGDLGAKIAGFRGHGLVIPY